MTLAEKVLKIEGNGIATGDNVPKTFSGYISSFGASLVQSGLLPTLAFHCKKDGNSTEAKDALVTVLATMLQHKNPIAGLTLKNNLVNDIAFFRSVINMDKNKQSELLNELNHAAIALKLVLRTYNLTN